MTDAATPAWRPLLFDPAVPEQADALAELRRGDRVWELHDTLASQLHELAQAREPGRVLARTELEAASAALREGRPVERWGRWVYYPWSGRLVHTLPPEQFRQLRLDRNRNKITAAEQERLGRLTVGVVGLSVGNAVVLTLALEGACGHMRLADGDRLALSNLNRLRASVADLGLPKTVLAARQVHEIDPYVGLSLFGEGLTEGNLAAFLDGPPALDVVVDECDDPAMKVTLREAARSRRLPVLMETSERGMLDVERFDLEPERALLHGLLGQLDAAAVRRLSRTERMGLVHRIVPPDAISARMAASLAEIGRTISTWPQLASDVVLGGATVAAAVRRIGLGQDLPSGRRHVDLDAVLATLRH